MIPGHRLLGEGKGHAEEWRETLLKKQFIIFPGVFVF